MDAAYLLIACTLPAYSQHGSAVACVLSSCILAAAFCCIQAIFGHTSATLQMCSLQFECCLASSTLSLCCDLPTLHAGMTLKLCSCHVMCKLPVWS